MDDMTTNKYSIGSKWLHWLVAVIVMTMLSFSFFLDDIPERYQAFAYMIHKSFGLTVLLLMVLRLIWIIHSGKPPLPNSIPKWEKKLSHIVQHSFYVFLILMPISGWVMSVAAGRAPVFFTLFKLSIPGVPLSKPLAHFLGDVHEIIAWVLISLLSLHLLGVIKHYFIDKDGVVERMFNQ